MIDSYIKNAEDQIKRLNEVIKDNYEILDKSLAFDKDKRKMFDDVVKTELDNLSPDSLQNVLKFAKDLEKQYK